MSDERLSRGPATRAGTALVVAGALLLDTACFAYRPAVPARLAPGGDVRIELTTEGTSEFDRILGPRIRTVVGQVQEITTDSAASILISDLLTADGVSVPWTGRGRVGIPARFMASAQLRTLDRRQTWIVGSILGAVFTAVIVSAIQKTKSTPSGKTPPGSPTPDAVR